MIQIKSIILLFVFAFSNIGTAMEFHYCDGELTDVGLVGQLECHCPNAIANDCCEADTFVEVEHLSCEHSNHADHDGKEEMDHSDCCKSDVVDMSSSELMLEYHSLSSSIITLFVWANFQLFDEPVQNNILISEHPVLPTQKSRQVLFQTFLI